MLKLSVAFVLEQFDLILVLDLLVSQLLLHDIDLSLHIVGVLFLLIFTPLDVLSLVLQIVDLLIHHLELVLHFLDLVFQFNVFALELRSHRDFA